MHRIKRVGIWALCAALPVLFSSLPAVASSIVLDFETEDDFSTTLVNGQIVDPDFDAVDLEFGNLVNVTSTQIGAGSGHLGVTVFDSSDPGPNDSGGDPDLLVNLGNILILQNDAFSTTANDTPEGLRYTTPNDEADFDDRGSIFFDFLLPIEPESIDLIDINGGVEVTVTLTDTNNFTRVYSVPEKWTFDINDHPAEMGYDTLFLNTLAPQDGEGPGGNATAVEDAGFDVTMVASIDVAFLGNSPSGGLDNLTFVAEPSTCALLLIGGAVCALVGLRRGRRKR